MLSTILLSTTQLKPMYRIVTDAESSSRNEPQPNCDQWIECNSVGHNSVVAGLIEQIWAELCRSQFGHNSVRNFTMYLECFVDHFGLIGVRK